MNILTKLVFASAVLFAFGCGGEEPYESLSIAEAQEQDVQCEGRTKYGCDEELFVSTVREFVPDMRDEPDEATIERGYAACRFLDANDPGWLGDLTPIYMAEGMTPDQVERVSIIQGAAAGSLCPEWRHLWEN